MVNRAKRPDRRHLLAAVRHPARRDGVIALVLFVLPWVALAPTRRHHLDVGTQAVIFGLAAMSIGLATLWLTWAALRVAQRDTGTAAGPSLVEIADGLVGRLRSQWQREAKARGLNDPYPLQVSWTAADPPLAGDLDALRTLATSGAGWSAPIRETGPGYLKT